jgi:diamine N-acetyltransferase
MNSNNITLDGITTADIPELQELGRQTFLEAFSSDNDEAVLKQYLDAAFSASRLAQELSSEDSAFFFAKINGKPIGYLKINLRHAQTELQDGNGLEIERIYVLQEFHGKDVGQRLFEHALKMATENNVDYLWLGVWEKNPRAIRFYEKNGFVNFGTHIFKLGDEAQTDVMMKLALKK